MMTVNKTHAIANPNKKYGLFSKRTLKTTGTIKATRFFKTREAARNAKTSTQGIVNLSNYQVIR